MTTTATKTRSSRRWRNFHRERGRQTDEKKRKKKERKKTGERRKSQ